jgi:aspartate/methionine/tyrosine aminotransferase
MQASGVAWTDLTESNPTRAGFAYSEALLAPLSGRRSLAYEPQPLGLREAREAVARDQLRRGAHVDLSQVVLTASTSEAYAWIFKLLCNPGESVLVPRPSYPLFEHLTRLEGIESVPYELEYHGRWEIDVAGLASRVTAATKAVLLVTPNNPTGSYVTAGELEPIAAVCGDRGLAIVADEVFADYSLHPPPGVVTDIAARCSVLSFTLGGLSKSVGLPQLKLGWIIVGGAPPTRAEALSGLEMVADTFLSVSTPVQVAAADLLAGGAVIRSAILNRLLVNLARLRHIAGQFPAANVLACEGGWYAVVRVPTLRPEEELVLELLDQERVLVHPGYFFDFPRETFLIVSLLPEPEGFAEAAARMLQRATTTL